MLNVACGECKFSGIIQATVLKSNFLHVCRKQLVEFVEGKSNLVKRPSCSRIFPKNVKSYTVQKTACKSNFKTNVDATDHEERHFKQ